MKSTPAFFFVIGYGLSIRLLFGLLDDLMSIMGLAFLVIVPLVVGFLTIIIPPARATQSRVGAFFKPWLSSLVLLVITIVFQIEGTICWVMIYPFFAILAGIGGLIAYQLRRKKKGIGDFMSDWDKPNTLKLSAVLLLPLLMGAVEGDRTSATQQMQTTKEITIAAPVSVVWRQLASVNHTTTHKRSRGIVSFLGFPEQVKTVTDTFSTGGKRTAIFEKGLVFTETITGYEKEKRLVLDIDVDPAKISPAVLDEHIVIGGKHVDVLQDIYTLAPVDDHHCKLTLSSRYTITTPFNWYAQLWAKLLMGDILSNQLKMVEEQCSTSAQ